MPSRRHAHWRYDYPHLAVVRSYDPPLVHRQHRPQQRRRLERECGGGVQSRVADCPNISQFLTTGASLASVSNVKDFFFIEGPGAKPTSNANQYITGLKNGGINPRALWWWNSSGSSPTIIDGVPSFFTALNISQTNLTTQAECNTAILSAISNAHSNFIMFFLNTTWPNPSYLKSACSSHNCIPLSPGTFANLYRKAHGLAAV